MAGDPQQNSTNNLIQKTLEAHPHYQDFLQIKQQLQNKGYVCWIAGGAVRDFLLQRSVADFDLVTDATTEQVMQIFPNALAIGASFGVVKVALPSQKNIFFDLATFRRESDYEDGRRPSHVDYATPEEDAGRRDFTINALFWDDEAKKVVDYVDGLKDLEQKLLRCVGDAEIRFQEDHLRILRLLRFSIQLNCACEEKTLKAALARVLLLEKISGERIWAELQKMILTVKWTNFFKQPLAMAIFEFLFQKKNQNVTEAIEKTLSNLDLIQDTFQDTNLNAIQGAIQSVNLKTTQNFALEKFFFVLLQTTKLAATKQTLKDRLKIGSDNLKKFDQLQFAVEIQFDIKYSPTVAHWAYSVEKTPSLIETLTFLTKLNQFPKTDFDKIESLTKNPPPKLITGDDLKNKIEKEKLGEILKKIRLHQFEQPDLTKNELLELVQDHFNKT